MNAHGPNAERPDRSPRVRRMVDLSHHLDDATPVYPGDPQVRVRPAATVAADGFNVLHVAMGSQSGTHVDAPRHYLDDGVTIDVMDLDRFVGPAVVVDVRHRGARQAIGPADLDAARERLTDDSLVVLHTGWSRHWGTDAYHDHPYLDVEAARILAAADVRAVAIDAMSVDETIASGPHPTGYAAHHALLPGGIAIVENLTGLEQVDWVDPVLSVLPLKLRDADGAPCRAVMLELV
jgi:kynurenine formamidase